MILSRFQMKSLQGVNRELITWVYPHVWSHLLENLHDKICLLIFIHFLGNPKSTHEVVFSLKIAFSFLKCVFP